MKKVFTAVIAFVLLFGGNTAIFAAQDNNPAGTVSTDNTYSEDSTQALNHLNEIRAKMGLQPVKLNPFLTKAAENHANYVVMSRYEHQEVATEKGFTGVEPWDRVKAVGGDDNLVKGQWEIMSYDSSDPIHVVDGFFDTVYHRVPLMNPNATEIGVGIVEKAAVIEIASKETNKDLSVYPYNGQTNVGIAFNGNEDPNPLTKFGATSSGYMVTIKTPYYLEEIKATIKNSKGEDIPFFQLDDLGYWHLLPKTQLDYNETYIVSVDYSPAVGSDKGKQFKKTWSFKTMSDPKTQVSKYNNKNVGIKINGKYVELDPKPKLIGPQTFIPLRGVIEKIGGKVTWVGETQSVIIEKGDTKVKLTIGSKTAEVNDQPVKLTLAPLMSDGFTYVPLRFVSKTMGAKVDWYQGEWTALIETKQ